MSLDRASPPSPTSVSNCILHWVKGTVPTRKGRERGKWAPEPVAGLHSLQPRSQTRATGREAWAGRLGVGSGHPWCGSLGECTRSTRVKNQHLWSPAGLEALCWGLHLPGAPSQETFHTKTLLPNTPRSLSSRGPHLCTTEGRFWELQSPRLRLETGDSKSELALTLARGAQACLVERSEHGRGPAMPLPLTS